MAWSSSGASVLADGQVRWTWNTSNLFSVGWDLNPLAMQIGAGADGVRDSLSDARDHFYQPLANQYRSSVYPASGYGGHAPEDDYSLYNDSNFREWVQTGRVPIPQAQIDSYQAELIRQTAAAPPPGIPLNNLGGIDNTDANVIAYLQANGVNTLPTGKVIAPIAGSDVFTGTVNLPSAQNTGAFTGSPSLAGIMASASPATGYGGYSYDASAPGFAGYGAGSNPKTLILLAAAAAAFYLLTKGKK
jgi:hypothetical protein